MEVKNKMSLLDEKCESSALVEEEVEGRRCKFQIKRHY